MLKKLLKRLAAHSPVALTKNEYYDRLTLRVIKRVCSEDSICIDVGANEGKILTLFTRYAPRAVHYAFEPIPSLYELLKRKYTSAVRVYCYALAAKNGSASFNHVITDPAYSGLQKRRYDKPERDETITVKTARLDDIIPADVNIKLIKMDIEGGEYNALEGATKTLQRSKPYLLFEFGKAGAEAYNVTPIMMYERLQLLGYNINTLPRFLNKALPLTCLQFQQFFAGGAVYFFIAYP